MKRVNCSDVRDAFQAGDMPKGAQVEAHLRECESCSELFDSEARLGRALGESAPSALPDEELWGTVERAVRAEVGPRAWLRSRPTWQRVLLALAPALLALLVAAQKLRADWADYPVLAGASWLVLFAALTFSSLSLLFAPLGRTRPPAALSVGLGVVALALPILYAAGLSEPVASGARTEHGAALWAHAAACFAYGGSLALPFVALVVLLERGERLAPSAGLFLGAAAGLVGNAALLVHCALNDPLHLLLGHASIGCGLVAALVARATRSR